LERDTYTSTKLKLHVFTDAQCSQQYDDGQSVEQHTKRGYDINGYYFSSSVSFRPPFYSCMTCKPTEISESFSKEGTYWFDDDAHVRGEANYDDAIDDYFLHDDAYFKIQEYINNEQVYKKEDDDDFYTDYDDDDADNNRVRLLKGPQKELTPLKGTFENFKADFWAYHHRHLDEDEGDDDGVGQWNICQKVYHYGLWCDEECRDIDVFRIDEWSTSDIFLLVIMGIFMGSMMLLIFAKRLKAYEKASVYADELNVRRGCPPWFLGILFILILVAVIVLANLRLVNETLVFAVVTCILLFIYMLKLTLFESKITSYLPSGKPRYEYS